MLANNRPATVPAAYRKPVSALLRDMGAVFNGADGRIPFRPDPLAHALRGGSARSSSSSVPHRRRARRTSR